MIGGKKLRINGVDLSLLPNSPSEPHSRAPMTLARAGSPLPDLPSSASLRSQCPPVHVQDGLGSCVAHGFTSAVEFLHMQTGRNEQLSPLFCQWVARMLIEGQTDDMDGCKAASMVAALEGYGVCSESVWPYDVRRANERPPPHAFDDAATRRGITAIPLTTLRAIKASINDGFPVALMFTVARAVGDGDSGEPSPTWKTGSFPIPDAYRSAMGSDVGGAGEPAERAGSRLSGVSLVPLKPEGKHCVLAIGYDDVTRKVTILNSWGYEFGNDGFGDLDYAFFGPSQDTCIQTSDCAASDAWTVRAQGGVAAEAAPRDRLPSNSGMLLSEVSTNALSAQCQSNLALLQATTRGVELIYEIDVTRRGSQIPTP